MKKSEGWKDEFDEFITELNKDFSLEDWKHEELKYEWMVAKLNQYEEIILSKM